MEDREAAVMPLAALTGYRALFSRGRLKAGERILITGAGGGVSQWMLAMAKSAGAAIWVTTGQQERLDRALLDGVKGGVLYRQAGWAQELAKQCPEGFDLIIDSAGGPGFSDLIETLKPGGRLVFFGATQGNVPELPIRKFYWRQLEMLGTTMGSPQDFENMLKFVTQHQLRPTLDSFIGIQDATSAMHRMEQGESFGKIAIQIKFD